MHTYEFSLSFRLTHPSDDLIGIYQKVSTLHDFTPGRIWKTGDQRSAQQGKTLEGVYKESYCYFSLVKNPQKSTVESPSQAIERALASLVPLQADLQNHARSGGELEFFLSLYIESNSGETFHPELIRKLADLKMRLSIDIYPPQVQMA